MVVNIRIFNSVLVLLVMGMCLGSCDRSEPKQNHELIEYKVEGEIIPFKGMEVLAPNSLNIIDNQVVVIESDLEEDFVKVFEAEELSFSHAFGKRGKGPGEFSSIISMPIPSVGNSSISIYDFVSKKVRQFNIQTTDASIASELEYVLPPSFMVAQGAIFLNDSTVLVKGGRSDGLFSIVDAHSDSSFSVNPFSTNNGYYTSRALRNFFNTQLAIDFKRERIVACTIYIPELFVFNFDGELIQSFKTAPYDVEQIIEQSDEEKTVYFHDVHLTEEFIYATYFGNQMSRIGEILDDENSDYSNLTQIFVFDWEGEHKETLQLAHGFYPFIEVTSDNKYIYALDFITGDNSLSLFSRSSNK